MIVKSTREYLFLLQKPFFVLSTPSAQQVDDTPYTLCDDTIGDATLVLTAFFNCEEKSSLGNTRKCDNEEETRANCSRKIREIEP